MHTIASEMVVGAEEHAAAVSPYPYNLQPARTSQDAAAEPVAKVIVPQEERAEVAATQWAEDNQNSFADPMPTRNPHGSSAALRAALTRGPVSLPSDEQLPRCTRNSFGALCAFYRGSARRTSERTEIHARGLGGKAIDGVPSCTSYGPDSERSDGGTRARGSASAQLDLISGIAMGRNTWPDLKFVPDTFSRDLTLRLRYQGESTLGGQDSCEVRCVRDVPRTRTVHPAAILTRLRRGDTSSVARDVLVLCRPRSVQHTAK
ncbi:hypothetical protein FB451DRAFT_1437411 [Mycena latifolia]|nr:hypothetical protein FB451DRAFT_1437411 [Mycena latifolia]